MCNTKQKVYRITLSSADKVSGNDQSARYIVRLPYTVKNGYLYLESLAILGAGTMLNNVSCVRVCCPSLQSTGHFYTGANTLTVLEAIPLLTTNVNAADDLFYKKEVNGNSIGFPINDFNLNNNIFDIELRDQDDTLLAEAQIASYVLTLLVVDNEPNFIEY